MPVSQRKQAHRKKNGLGAKTRKILGYRTNPFWPGCHIAYATDLNDQKGVTQSGLTKLPEQLLANESAHGPGFQVLGSRSLKQEFGPCPNNYADYPDITFSDDILCALNRTRDPICLTITLVGESPEIVYFTRRAIGTGGALVKELVFLQTVECKVRVDPTKKNAFQGDSDEEGTSKDDDAKKDSDEKEATEASTGTVGVAVDTPEKEKIPKNVSNADTNGKTNEKQETEPCSEQSTMCRNAFTKQEESTAETKTEDEQSDEYEVNQHCCSLILWIRPWSIVDVAHVADVNTIEDIRSDIQVQKTVIKSWDTIRAGLKSLGPELSTLVTDQESAATTQDTKDQIVKSLAQTMDKDIFNKTRPGCNFRFLNFDHFPLQRKEGEKLLCSQSWGGHLTHIVHPNTFFAVDWDFPLIHGEEGLPLIAVADATVVETKVENETYGPDVTNLFNWNQISLEVSLDDLIPKEESSNSSETVFAGLDRSAGNTVIVEYVHIHSVCVHVEDKVKAGQIIGKGGRTGFTPTPHLHLQVVQSRGEELSLPFTIANRFFSQGEFC